MNRAPDTPPKPPPDPRVLRPSVRIVLWVVAAVLVAVGVGLVFLTGMGAEIDTRVRQIAWMCFVLAFALAFTRTRWLVIVVVLLSIALLWLLISLAGLVLFGAAFK